MKVSHTKESPTSSLARLWTVHLGSAARQLRGLRMVVEAQSSTLHEELRIFISIPGPNRGQGSQAYFCALWFAGRAR